VKYQHAQGQLTAMRIDSRNLFSFDVLKVLAFLIVGSLVLGILVGTFVFLWQEHHRRGPVHSTMRDLLSHGASVQPSLLTKP
jgi:hypothetical protein